MINYEFHVTCDVCGSLYGFWASTQESADEECVWHAQAWGHFATTVTPVRTIGAI